MKSRSSVHWSPTPPTPPHTHFRSFSGELCQALFGSTQIVGKSVKNSTDENFLGTFILNLKFCTFISHKLSRQSPPLQVVNGEWIVIAMINTIIIHNLHHLHHHHNCQGGIKNTYIKTDSAFRGLDPTKFMLHLMRPHHRCAIITTIFIIDHRNHVYQQ